MDTSWLDETMGALFPNSKKMRIADIGTGCGFLSVSLAKMEHEVTATDISPNMLKEAISLATVHESNVRFIEDDILDTKLPKSSFDFVIMKDVMFTLDDPLKGLQNCLNLVSPGGLVAIVDGNYFLHDKLDEYSQRARYRRLKNGINECAHLLNITEDQFLELNDLVGSSEINCIKRPNNEMHFLLNNGFDNIRVICDNTDPFIYLSEKGRMTAPIRYVVFGKKPLNADSNFIRSVADIRNDSFLINTDPGNAESVFAAIGNKDRIKIVKLLLVKPKSVKELSNRLGLSENKTSYHLKVLKNSGFVERKKTGREVVYSIVDGFSVESMLIAAEKVYKR